MAGLPSMTATEEMLMGAAVRTTQGASRADTACSGAGFWTLHAATVILFALIAVMISATALVAPYFPSARKFASKAEQIAPLAITSLGQVATILLRGIDLSVGPTTSLVTGVASNLLAANSSLQPTLGILACLGIGALNGTLIVALRTPDLVATLAAFSIVQSAALIVRPAPGGTLDQEVTGMIPQRVVGFLLVFVMVLALFLMSGALLARGRIGARLFATGASPQAAAVVCNGIGRIRFAAYLFSGVMAALAGLTTAARIGPGDPQAGSTFTLVSALAVVVGGASVFGSAGAASGTFLEAALIILLHNLLNRRQVSAYWQYV